MSFHLFRLTLISFVIFYSDILLININIFKYKYINIVIFYSFGVQSYVFLLNLFLSILFLLMLL